MGDSFVRALPFSQVKSANANGSLAGFLAVPEFPSWIACAVTEAMSFSAEMTFVLDLGAAGPEVSAELTANAVALSMFAELG